MADVLIRGIEMPCNAEGCEVIIRIQPNGEVLDAHKIHIGATAISLPEGHGRLGDLDALSESLAESATFKYNKRTSVTWADAFESMIDILEEADTIVPADGGMDND